MEYLYIASYIWGKVGFDQLVSSNPWLFLIAAPFPTLQLIYFPATQPPPPKTYNQLSELTFHEKIIILLWGRL